MAVNQSSDYRIVYRIPKPAYARYVTDCIGADFKHIIAEIEQPAVDKSIVHILTRNTRGIRKQPLVGNSTLTENLIG